MPKGAGKSECDEHVRSEAERGRQMLRVDVEPKFVKIWAEESQRFHEIFADSKELITPFKRGRLCQQRPERPPKSSVST